MLSNIQQILRNCHIQHFYRSELPSNHINGFLNPPTVYSRVVLPFTIIPQFQSRKEEASKWKLIHSINNITYFHTAKVVEVCRSAVIANFWRCHASVHNYV